MCTSCNPAATYWLSQDLSLFSFGVSLLKFSFRFPTTYGAHTRPRVHLVGSLNPSWRNTSTEAAPTSRRRYESSQVSYRQMSVESVLLVIYLYEVCVCACFNTYVLYYALSYICDRARINQPYAAIDNLRVRAFIGDSRPSRP